MIVDKHVITRLFVGSLVAIAGGMVLLLVTGLLSFGLIGMIVYLIAAPDSDGPVPPANSPPRFPARPRPDGSPPTRP